MKKIALLAAFLAFLGLKQAVADQVVGNSFKGINSNENSVIIDPAFAQDGLNFDVTPGGKSVKKRSGYGVYKALGTSAGMRGGYHAYDSSGNNYQLWGSSRSLYGIVADATPVALVTSGTLNSTWDCTDTQGSSYCVNSNRDVYLKTNGTTFSWNTSPLGTMVESTPDRVIVAGVSGSPNTLFVSQSNTFTNFTVGTNATDAFQEVIASPGSKLTHIRWGCGKLLWWKDQSFGYFDFDDQFIAQVKTVSDSIGTFDNTSAIDPGGQVWFRGQDGHTWKYDCSILVKESIDITPNVLLTGNRVANSWSQTTQSDFQAGSVTANGPSNSLSTTISAGDVVPSSITLTDTISSDFGQGSMTNTIDTTTVSDAIILKNYFSDSFQNMNNWTNLGFGGLFSASGSKASCGASSECRSYSDQTINNDFSIQSTVKREFTSVSDYVAIAALNSFYQGYVLHASTGVIKICVNTAYQTAQVTQANYCTVTVCSAPNTTSAVTLGLTRDSTSNTLSAYANGVLVCSGTDSNYTSFTKLGMGAFAETNASHSAYYDTARKGNFTSRVFDTAFSTPVWGTLSGGTNGGGTYGYAVKVSADNISYSTDVVVTTTTKISANPYRYIKYSSTLTATGYTNPQLTDVSIVAASTGTFYSVVRNAPSLVSWGTFAVTKQDNGGSQSFYLRASTNSFTVLSSTPSWSSQMVGGLVSVTTGTYFQVRDDFSLTSGTQAPALSDFTVGWFEGAASDQAYMIYFDNAIWETIAYGSGQSTNNYIFKRDLINDGWTLYNFGAGGLLVQSNMLYFGDTSAGNIFNYGTATSDNGTAIQSFWRSKSYTGNDPFLQTALTNIDVFAKKDQGTTLTSTYTTDTSTATSYSISLSTSNAITQSRKLLPAGKMGYVFDLKLGDTSTSSAWELLGYRIGFNQQPYRQTTP